MQRTDLVVPSYLVADLRIPPLAVTDGTADPEWVELPLSRWRFRRKPSLRLPVDPGSAQAVRRYLRFAPWSALPPAIALAALLSWRFADASRAWSQVLVLVAGGVTFLWSMLPTGELPNQVPFRTRPGDLRIPRVPLAVAQEWVGQNPGVTTSDEPAPRPHSRRFYATWAAGLLAAAVALYVVLENDGRENDILLWTLVPILLITGVVMALKTQPPTKPDPELTRSS